MKARKKYDFLVWVLLIVLFPLMSLAEETKEDDEKNTDQKEQTEEKKISEKKTSI